ncbi:hypothetical protein COOONC_15353 [Cooperia oncophora]
MLVAMRSRKRFGETVSVDDAIFSCDIVKEFFRRLQNASVPVGVRSMFAKAILSFYRFLQENIGTAAGIDRINGIQQAVALAEREVNRLKNENEMLSTFSGISAERRLQELERYCAVRAIVKSKRIDERVAYMVQAFNENGSINHYNYNYCYHGVFGALQRRTKRALLQDSLWQHVWSRRRMQRTRTGGTPTYLEIGAILRCGSVAISCNLTRRSVARMEYEKYMEEKMKTFRPIADPHIARLQSHRQRTQEEIYVERYQKSCVYGYVKLRALAKEESKKNDTIKARVAEVKRMVKASYLTGPELEQARNVIRIDDEDTSEFSEESLDDAVGDYRDLAGLSESDADQPSTSTGLRASKRKKIEQNRR